jgi:hypothetical protein
MATRTFSERLANERRKRGLSIEQASTTLRIRPAIIESFERGDFSHMPLKGHARNMVSSYARFLGLDPADLTAQFLREYHDFEERQARSGASRPSAYNEDDPEQTGSLHRVVVPASRETVTARRRDQGSQSFWNTASPSQLGRGFDSRSPSAQRIATASARRSTYDGSMGGGGGNIFVRLIGSLLNRPLALIIGLVVLLVLILVLWAVAANSCASNADDNVLPVTGGVGGEPQDVDDGATGLTPEEVAAQLEEQQKYGPFSLKVEVDEGTEAWILITIGGEVVLNEVITGPYSKSWEVVVDVTVETWGIDGVKVYRYEKLQEYDLDGEIPSVYLKVEPKPADENAQAAGNAQDQNTATTE